MSTATMPSNLTNLKGAAALEEAAKLIMQASKMLDRAGNLLPSDLCDRMNDIPGMDWICCSLADPIKALADEIFASEGGLS